MIKSEYKQYYIQEILNLYNDDKAIFMEALSKLMKKEIIIVDREHIKAKNNLGHLLKEKLNKEKLMTILILYSDLVNEMNLNIDSLLYCRMQPMKLRG